MAWVAVYATRARTLGFYSDDWEILLVPTLGRALLSVDYFASVMKTYANRPLHGLATFVLSATCGDSPVLWHIATAVLALLCGMTLYQFFKVSLRLCGSESAAAAAGAAALWMLFPWMLGTTAWPSMGPAILAVILFALAGRVLIDGLQRGELPCVAPASLLLASMLTYEAFYGQFPVLLLMGIVGGAARHVGLRRLTLLAASCVAAQALAFAWNRLAPFFWPVAATKSLSALWATKLLNSVTMLPYLFRHSAPESSPLPELVAGLLAITCAGAILSRLRRVEERRRALQQLALLALAGLGALTAFLVLALAGYSYWWTGHESRTLLSPSTWLALACAVALAGALRCRIPVRVTAITCCVALAVLMARATRARLCEWAEVWDIQRQTIADAPVAQLHAAAANSVVLVTGPHRHKGLTIFAYPWDLDGLMKFNFPWLARLRFLPARDDYMTTWDGQTVTQHKGHTLLRCLQADEVWLWAREQRRAERLSPPFQFPARLEGEK